MAKVFISYRRDDTQYQADKLYDLFKANIENPDANIFIDVDNIPFGVDFVDHLGKKVGQCDILLALIGKSWLDVINPKTGQRRLHEKDDFVRIEIAEALRRKIRVVPIMFDGASLPEEEDLPEDLRPLVRRNGIPISRSSFDHDVTRLLRGLELATPSNPSPEPQPTPDIETLEQEWSKIASSKDAEVISAFWVKAKGTKLERAVSSRLRDVKLLRQSQKTAKQDDDKSKAPLIIGGSIAAILLAGVATLFIPAVPWSLNKTDEPIIHAQTTPSPTPSVTEVEPQTPSSTQLAEQAAQRDDAAWESTLSQGTIAAYKSYNQNIDYTKHKAKAETAINRYTQSVMRLQTALNAKGFNAGTADGVAGSGTRRAVDAYRAKVNYSVSSVDLTQIDANPINTIAASVENWIKPEPEVTPKPAPVIVSSNSTSYPVGKSFTDCSGCPEVVVVPSGSFKMGSPSSEPERDDDEGPQRTVRIGYKFAVGKYEVTWAQWEACVSAGGCNGSGPEGAGGDKGWGKGSRPVVEVSWNDAKAYAKWLSGKTGHNYRLLSEAEWEYAARAGTTTPFSTGQRITTSQANFNGNYMYNGSSKGTYREKTLPVGSFSANAFGLYDMHGNVWEWVEDWYKEGYSHTPTDGRSFTNCSNCS